MKIKTKFLTDFLSKVQMSGTQQIMECILDFQEDGLHISADCPSEQSKAVGFLKAKAFNEYEVLGKIGVNDFDGFIGALGRFSEIIELNKQGNVLIVNEDKKTVEIELIHTDFIPESKPLPEMVFETTFKLPPKKMQGIFEDANLSKDAIIKIETGDNKIMISNTGKYKFTNVFNVPDCKAGTKTKFGEPLVEAIKKLTGELTIYVTTDYPMKIVEENEESCITIVVAPRVEEA